MHTRGILRRWWRSLGVGILLIFSQAVHADISGKVFRDFDGDGVLTANSSFNEVGMAGVTVRAFDATGVEKATAVSASDGSYSLAGLANGADYRLEFSWPESWLKSGAAGGTAVQFVKDGATGVDFAVLNPDDFSNTTNPYLVIPQYINGDSQASGTIADQAGLFVFPYGATSADYTNQTPAPVVKATMGQIGATWGTAFQRSTQTLYTSAALRRFVGFGPLGIGGIYKVDMSDPTTASSGSLNYIDVKSIGIPVGDSPRDATSCNSLATDMTQPAHDIAAAEQIGTIGIGGITMDNEHNRLWLVNMADKKLYGIQNVSPATTPTAADVLGGYGIALPSGYACQNGELRPWGVKYHEGNVYVGVVCDASSAPYPGTDELMGYVLRFDPTNPTSGFAVEHSFGFSSPRAGYGPNADSTWSAWYHSDSIVNVPLIASIEFDLDGSLMLGILDRSTIITGTNNYNSLNCSDTNLSDYTGSGDVLRFCKSAGSYREDGTTGCATAIPASVKTHEEYYWGDYGPIKDDTSAFNETTQGGLAFLPGSGQLVSNGFDLVEFHEGGVYWLNNQTGGDDNRYFLYATETGVPYVPATMGKTSGLGDLEMVLDPAPVEIGNRVWLDSDGDGIQDAGEASIPGVEVKLLAADGVTELAVATTAADGTYYFSSAAGTSTASTLYGVSALQPGTAYTLKFPTAVTVSGAAYKPTTVTVGGNREIDSNASSAGLVPITTLDIPVAGANNHSFDVGYAETKVDVALTKTVEPATAKRGDTVVYTLTVTNAGEGVATGVKVTDKLPAGLVFVSHDGSTPDVYDAITGEWNVGTVGVGAANAVTLKVTATVK
ncbi:SdrD B-like domain-containing protein [Candidatus Thiothrix sp. Deng01]|uniref:SdrD B-like domain-containing protein n=1 Tax=Candidatus Thiothrix phosphatis TaxID=3112415 RepID=A0ABU6CSZ6_9GAMM|nr:SdrD B-like domain-containing protein [Candidatus Thiothrix sp. Deng01]MEB4589935.1 SdrD B-like domain-containing protein [Candidatus Thiothrix sp. Deng01]